MHFALTDEQQAIQETALAFARERIAPGAAEWDEKGHFPVDVIRETAALGMGTAAFVAFIARSTHPAYTATQMALFTSLAAVPRTFINASAGWLVEMLGWTSFFWLCAVLAVPGMVLLLKVAPWNLRDAEARPAA